MTRWETYKQTMSVAPSLWSAAKENDVPMLAELLAGDLDIDGRDHRGFSALMLAAYAGNAEAFDYLLARGASPNTADLAGNTFLMGAAFKGNVDFREEAARRWGGPHRDERKRPRRARLRARVRSRGSGRALRPNLKGSSRWQRNHPNSFDDVEVTEERCPPYAHTGPVSRHDHRGDEDCYSQAGALYRLMSAEQRTLLVSTIVGAMKSVPDAIKKRQIAHFTKADPEYGERVAKGLDAARPGDPRQVPVVK